MTRKNVRKRNIELTFLYLKSVPLDVKLQFKAWCSRRGKTMTDTIVEMMRKQLRSVK